MVHDFAVTAIHVVFPVLPLTGDLDRALSGRPPFAWDPAQGGFLGVMRRDRGVASLAWTAIEPCFAYHVMNAFDADGGIVIDVVEYGAAPLFPNADGSPPDPDATRSRLARWRVDAAAQGPVRRELLDDLPGEFPRLDERRAGLPYRSGFRICSLPDTGADAIVHHDVERRTRRLFALNEGERASEAVFVPASPDAPEAEGWLLTLAWRPERGSSLLVFDAQALEPGPIAEVAMPRRVPFGFHGSWTPE